MNRSKSNKKMSHAAKKQRALRNQQRGRTPALIKAKQWERKHVKKEPSGPVAALRAERAAEAEETANAVKAWVGHFVSGSKRVNVERKQDA